MRKGRAHRTASLLSRRTRSTRDSAWKDNNNLHKSTCLRSNSMGIICTFKFVDLHFKSRARHLEIIMQNIETSTTRHGNVFVTMDLIKVFASCSGDSEFSIQVLFQQKTAANLNSFITRCGQGRLPWNWSRLKEARTVESDFRKPDSSTLPPKTCFGIANNWNIV